jgi:hypothetical protein
VNRCRDQQLHHGDRPWLFVFVFVVAPTLSETTRQYPERPVDHGNIMHCVFPMGEQIILREQTVTRNPLSLSSPHARTNNTKKFPCLDPSTLYKQNSVFDFPTPYNSFPILDKLYIKNSFLWGTQYTKNCRFLYTRTILSKCLSLRHTYCIENTHFFTYLRCTKCFPIWAHILYTYRIKFSFSWDPSLHTALPFWDTCPMDERFPAWSDPFHVVFLKLSDLCHVCPTSSTFFQPTFDGYKHPEMRLHVMWLKFTTGSRKPAASTSSIEEYSEERGSMFFETYVNVYQATLHRITDDSYLQDISHFGKTCVRKISSNSMCTLQTVKHRREMHLAFTNIPKSTSSLCKL